MLYMVECRFTDPAREAAWNAWYGGERLGELLAVPGFLTSQRLISLTHSGNYYLTVHSIRDMDVFQCAEYKAMGGGAFKGYQDCITDWTRRFFTGVDVAPAVGVDQRLLVADCARGALAGCDLPFTWMQPMNQPGKPPDTRGERGLACVSARQADALLKDKRYPIDVYQPMQHQRTV
jgi:hypothetical protein